MGSTNENEASLDVAVPVLILILLIICAVILTVQWKNDAEFQAETTWFFKSSFGYPHTVNSPKEFRKITDIVDVNGKTTPVPKGLGTCNYPISSRPNDCCAITKGADIYELKSLGDDEVLYQIKNQDLSQPEACPFESFYIISSWMTNDIKFDLSEKIASDWRNEAITSAIKDSQK